MNKSKQASQAESEKRIVGSRGNGEIISMSSRRSPRREPHSDFSDFGRDGGDNDFGFIADLFRRSSEE